MLIEELETEVEDELLEIDDTELDELLIEVELDELLCEDELDEIE